jgi:serine/threonine protein kinase
MPDAIAHYKILAHVGTGGLGELYRARDTKLGRTVALRVLPPSLSNEDRERLIQAARVVSGISHPNIAALFEVGEDGPLHYLAFEFVPGEPLTALVRGRPLNVRRAVDFAIQLADALAEAEAHEMVHGDVRPATIFITQKDRAKFYNFGLSEFTSGGAARRAALTDPESPVSRYVAPEEIGGRAPDIRSDIFGLGTVMYEMLTGRQAFRGRPAFTPPSISLVNSSVPKDLSEILSRTLAIDPDKRYQSAATLSAELRSIAAILDTRTAAAEANFDPPRAGSRRGRTVAVVVLLAAIAVIAIWIWRSGIWRLWQ